VTDALPPCSQSKLTHEQLTELQQATLFERKELQQWYKGSSSSLRARIGVLLTREVPRGHRMSC